MANGIVSPELAAQNTGPISVKISPLIDIIFLSSEIQF
jgi:hypothetical protein